MNEAVKLQATVEGGGMISECELEKVRFNEALGQWERQTGTDCDGIPERIFFLSIPDRMAIGVGK
ncbi:MAG: hypothetical protein ACLU30_09660 [Odoribacter splanchnicus]